MEHKADKKLIGTCGFVYWSPRNARAEIGYALSRKYWGRGYTTEAVRAVIAFGYVKGAYVDRKMYSILRAEWAAGPPIRTRQA